MIMKKSLFFAVAAAGMLAACSSHEDASDYNGIDVEANADQIKLGVSNAEVITRGAGTVGGLVGQDALNVWNSQPLYIYMTKKNSADATKPATMVLPTYTPVGGTATPLYEDEAVLAPSGVITGIVTPDDNSIKYYPLTGEYDFWGYYLGEATRAAGHTKPTLAAADRTATTDAETAAMYLQTFEIDGTQDLMQGKAALSTEDSTKLGIVKDADNSAVERYYSSYAARRGVQPNIYFNHLLTRFTFNVKPGNASTAGKSYDEATDAFVADEYRKAVKVTSIKLYSRTKGDFMVAYTPEATTAAQPIIKFEGDIATDAVALELKQRDASATTLSDLVDLEPVELASDNDKHDVDSAFQFVGEAHTIGDALMVEPDLSDIKIEITLQQEVRTDLNDATKTETRTQVLTKTLSAANLNADGKFLQGHSYNINITAYGYENIEIYATLVPWKDGGSINEDTDNVDEWDVTE